MNILFVCKHNRFRSKVAEAIAKKLDSKNEYKSAGIYMDLMRPYICENVKKVLAERGITKINEQARQVNEQDLKWVDILVIVANNVSPDMFSGNKVIVWKIPDADEKELAKIRVIVRDVEKKVIKLIDSIKE